VVWPQLSIIIDAVIHNFIVYEGSRRKRVRSQRLLSTMSTKYALSMR